MSKRLAIKGHSTRGKEVIEILEMMGGSNPFSVNDGMVIGNKETNCYYISENTATKYISWDYIGPEEIDKYEIFTLEEFWEKYPFKVGDEVMDGNGNSLTIKSMSWSTDCETMVYDFKETEDVLCAEDLLKSNAEFLVNKEKGEENGKMLRDITLNHLHRISLKNVLSELYEHIKTTSKEELEREFKEIESEGWTNVGPTVEEFMDFCNKVNKKPKYPTNYKECCEVLLIPPYYNLRYYTYEHGYNEYATTNELCSLQDKLNILGKLLICCRAYWKIAGEEMGLGKPWEPNWTTFEGMPAIFRFRYNIVRDSIKNQHCLLVFPTEEMRDAFHENFKDLIELCKELL